MTQKISIQDIKSAIKKSGYLIEQRVGPLFEARGFQIEANAAYKDEDTDVSREIDVMALYAYPLIRQSVDSIQSIILCECENNSQPIVFFDREIKNPSRNDWNIKCSGFPLEIIRQSGFNSSLNQFVGMNKFHHYCKERSFSSQYCSFHQKDKSKPWIAMHPDTQHNTFTSLVKCLDFEKDHHSELWLNKKPIINLRFYYPLLILQGDLFIATLKKKQLTFKKATHVQYLKNHISSKITLENSGCYHIDVIRERFLPRYLDMIKKEMMIIRKKIIENKKDIDNTIAKAVSKERERINRLALESSTCPPDFSVKSR